VTSAPRLLLRLAGLGHGHRGRIALAVLAGLGTIGCGIGLAATSGYLIAKAALHPPILELSVAVVAVRAFGIGRGALRYAERLAGHELALRLLADLRVRFYQGIERLGPAGLDHHRSGELVAGVVADVDTLQNLFLRVLTPPLVALGASGLALGLSAALLPGAAAVLALVLLAAGVGVPLLAAALGRTTGRRLSQSRGALAGEVVGAVGRPGGSISSGGLVVDGRSIAIAPCCAAMTSPPSRAALVLHHSRFDSPMEPRQGPAALPARTIDWPRRPTSTQAPTWIRSPGT
jgi:ABC-type multidrug transport system fused ATPase/permease subunit